MKIKKKEFKKLYDLACDSWKNKFDEKFKKQLSSDELDFEESFLSEMENACNEAQLKVFKSIFKEYKKEDVFSVKTYSQVCKKLGIKELTIKDFREFGENSKKMFNFYKIKNVEKFFNGTWVADWNNTSQYKYYPYWYKNSSGWSLHAADGGSYGYFGSVGYYKDNKTALHVGEHFKDVYFELIF